MTRGLWRAPLALCAVVSLVWGVWLGLLRIGWALPLPRPEHLILHGPLMVGGFLGTLIGLERAIGIARPWAYGAPVLSGVGALVLIFGPPAHPAGPILITSASLIVCAVFVTIVSRHVNASSVTMLAASGAWAVGNALWTSGFAISRIVFGWIAFLVLTIAGERLELNRLLRPSRSARAAFAACVTVVVVGSAMTIASPTSGVRTLGVGLALLTAWLAFNDVARRTVRQPGVTRYIAICLLTAYVWLGVAAAIAIASGVSESGFVHDALLHAIFLGFAITMVFGHAPIVFPAVTGLSMPFTAAFYIPYTLLQASVVVRVCGDLVDDLAQYRSWGGLLNAIALLVFVMTVAVSLATRKRSRAGRIITT